MTTPADELRTAAATLRKLTSALPVNALAVARAVNAAG